MSRSRGMSRRSFLAGPFRARGAALAAAGAFAWWRLLGAARGSEISIRPPGARPEPDFLASCIKCGQCVEACPFDTLRLANTGDDRAPGVPYFEPRATPCYMCEDAPCIGACPTEALEPTAIEDARMGLAVLLDQETCLAFQGLRCEVCYRVCPLMGRAIRLDMRPQARTGMHAYFLPVVDSEHCTGCGRCEHACVLEEPAIAVLPRDLAKGRGGEHYRFGWKEETEISRDFTAPEAPPSAAEWDRRMERALEALDDVAAIEKP